MKRELNKEVDYLILLEKELEFEVVRLKAELDKVENLYLTTLSKYNEIKHKRRSYLKLRIEK